MTFLKFVTYAALFMAAFGSALLAAFLLTVSVPAGVAWMVLASAFFALYAKKSFKTTRANAYLLEFELGSLQRVYVSGTFEQAEEEYIEAEARAGRDVVQRGIMDSDIVFLPEPFYEGVHYPMTQVTLHLNAVEQLTRGGSDSPPTLALVDSSLILRFSPYPADVIATFGIDRKSGDLARERDQTYMGVTQQGRLEERHYETPCLAALLLRKLQEPAHDAIRSVVGQMTFEDVVLNPPHLSNEFLLASARQDIFQQGGLLVLEQAGVGEDGNPLWRVGRGRSVLLIEYRVERLSFDATLQEALQRPRIAALIAQARAHEGSGERQYLEQLGEGERAFLASLQATGANAEQALASRTLRTVSSNVDIVFSDGGILGAAGARFLGRGPTTP